jgi:hypothetical protein
MRIDNQMAGYRPPPPKLSKKDTGASSGLVASLVHGSPGRSSLPDQSNQFGGDQSGYDSPKQKVHIRSKIEKAAYLLATRGAL